IIIFLFIFGVGHIDTENLKSVSWGYFFIPYGVILFSLWGTSIIPEIKEMLDGDLKLLRKVIIWGICLAAFVSLLFSLLVIGISGEQTSQEGLSGLEGRLGQRVLSIGYVFGIITTFTSFIALGLTTKKILWYDYGLNKRIAWFIGSFIPLFLFIIGLQNFIEIIGLTGAVMLGLDGLLVTVIFLKIKKQDKSRNYIKLKIVGTLLMILLSLGVILEFFYFIKGY
ncbi:hypothetical protein KKF61_00285, partial [Patescibacteria group bacterium]|nr:hypothetical protein [Patescibacteria group bacterium]